MNTTNHITPQAAGALTFSPDGILFVGDNKLGAVFALVAGGTPAPVEQPASSAATVSVSPTSVAAGGSVTVKGTLFQPGEQVQVWLHSTGVELATWTATAAGGVDGTVTIPAGTAAGAHQIALVGVTSGIDVAADLTVTSPVSSNSSTLPVTGANIAGGTGLGGALVLTGALALLVIRRRRWWPVRTGCCRRYRVDRSVEARYSPGLNG